MSDDPETARQIAELARDPRPLLALDVDDVLLDFVTPFTRYLDGQEIDLRLDTFAFFGNIFDRRSGVMLERDHVSTLLNDFFHVQADWQPLIEGAAEALSGLSDHVEIVLLTAMPHRHRLTRRLHLDALGMPYPLITTEAPKGPALRALRGGSGRPVAFVDDLPRNLSSARDSIPDVHLFHMTSVPELRDVLPPLPEGAVYVEDWRQAAPLIARALGI